MRRWAVGFLLASLLFVSCDPGALEAQPFEGIWQSDGWGTFLLIDGGQVEFFEHTSEHCLSVATAGARGITDAMSFEGERLVLRDADREIRLDRIEVLPVRCADAGPSQDPVEAARVLVATIEEQYIGELDPGWELRSSDVVGRAGSEDLFGLLVELVEPLDRRIRIAADGEQWPVLPALDAPDGAEPGGAGGYATADLPGGVAYLGLTRIGPFDSDPGESERIAGRVIDRVVRAETVVLDLRSSAGGTLREALLLASRFVPSSRVVGSMWARSPDGLVPAGELAVSPVPTGTFDGPVFVLIGPDTRGVAELFALLLGDLESVTLVGRPTIGDPGPPLVRFLTNTWSVAVPNLQIRDAAGSPIGAVAPDVVSDDPLAEALRLAG